MLELLLAVMVVIELLSGVILLGIMRSPKIGDPPIKEPPTCTHDTLVCTQCGQSYHLSPS